MDSLDCMGKQSKLRQIKTLNKNNPVIENNMKATMASILSSFNISWIYL